MSIYLDMATSVRSRNGLTGLWMMDSMLEMEPLSKLAAQPGGRLD
jgi:hypothetical protein